MPRVALNDYLRLFVAARDGLICQYCGTTNAPNYQIDHVVPVTLDGPNEPYNLVMACETCNERKKDRVQIPSNLESITADHPAWKAHVLTLAADPSAAQALRIAGLDRPHRAASLIPIQEQIIDFFDTPLSVFKTADGQLYVPVRRLAKQLGLNWTAQWERLGRDPILAAELCLVRTGGTPDALCLPLGFLPGWLLSIDTARLRPDVQVKLLHYRRAFLQLLATATQAGFLTTH